jgi:hypothetical protein
MFASAVGASCFRRFGGALGRGFERSPAIRELTEIE